MAMPRSLIFTALFVVNLTFVSACDSCGTTSTACKDAYDCNNDQVCVESVCRLTCNYNRDCAADELCFNGACVPGERPKLDASLRDRETSDQHVADREVLDQNVNDRISHDDVVLIDSRISDSAQADSHILDAGQVDSATVDSNVQDGALADIAVFDSLATDTNIPDTSISDAAKPDTYSNTPPVIVPASSALWTYPSSDTLNFPLEIDIEVNDVDNDAPFVLRLGANSDSACELIAPATLRFEPAEGFIGEAVCTLIATDSGLEPAVSAPQDFVFNVIYPKATCLDLRNDVSLDALGIGVEDGHYLIDPDGKGSGVGSADEDADPFNVYCDMHSYGGGWTLLLTKAGDGLLSENNLLESTPLGSISLNADFKSPAYSEMPMADLLFRSSDKSEFARYEGVGRVEPATENLPATYLSLTERFDQIPNRSCMYDEPTVYHMADGNIDGPHLCESSLFLNAWRTEDDNDLGCFSPETAIGPSWSCGDYENGGCPNYWARSGDLFGGSRFPDGSPFESQAVQIWARGDDMTDFAAASSCQVHYDAGQHISGYYLLSRGYDSPVQVYCRMQDDGQAWMRVAYLDMGHQEDCPGDWQRSADLRACVRDASVESEFIRSASFSVHGISYSQVKGFVKAYQFGTPDSFRDMYEDRGQLNSSYVDGISITTSSSSARTHIWTYAGSITNLRCPCNDSSQIVPNFVGSNYYCDSADTGVTYIWQVDNPLFDGMHASTCYSAGDPGWFERSLSTSRSDDIEVRHMAGQDSEDEDLGVTAMEIYVR